MQSRINKIDKLIKQVHSIKKMSPITGVHIVENGHCYSCNGSCKYLDAINQITIERETVITVIGTLDGHNGYADAPTETLIRILGDEDK